MADDQKLLKAIADAGGLDPVSVMRHLLVPERLIDQANASGSLLHSVMEYLISIKNEDVEARVKQILWDARVAMLEAADVEEDEKKNGLKVLDQIGVALLLSWGDAEEDRDWHSHRNRRGSRRAREWDAAHPREP